MSKDPQAKEPAFKCPKCKSQKTVADDPHSWVEFEYDDEGRVIDTDSHSGLVIMNESCASCEFPVDPSWGDKAI